MMGTGHFEHFENLRNNKIKKIMGAVIYGQHKLNEKEFAFLKNKNVLKTLEKIDYRFVKRS